MRLQNACFVLGAAVALTAPAWAQSKAITPTSTGTEATSTGTGIQSISTATEMQTTPTRAGTQTTSTGAFQNLSPGNQRIAQSLFNAQHPPTGTTALTLDQIATLKDHEGWGRVFKEMKADGLVQARNLGQVVSGHAQGTNIGGATGMAGSRHASTGRTGRTSTIVTNGAGRSMSFVSAGNRGGSRYAGGYSTHVTTGSGMSAGGMQAGGFQPGGGFHGSGGGGFHGGGHGR